MQLHSNRYIAGRVLAVGLSLALLSGGSINSDAQRSRQRRATLEAGTVIPVVLEDELTSNKSRKGDRFTAKLKPSDRGTYLGLPEGTLLEGRVTEATPKRDKDTPGILDIEFQRVRLPDGNAYAITSDLIPLDNKSVTTEDNGRIIAKPGSKREDLKYVGYGAAAGALISILGNRGRITIENLLLGGLAGFGASQIIKGPQEARDVRLKPGTEVGVRLEKPLRFTPVNEDLIPDEDRAPLTPSRDRDRDNRNRDRDNDDFGVMINDRNVAFSSDFRPFQSGETWMLPVKPMLEGYGSHYRYDSAKRTIQITEGDQRIRGTVGSNIVIMSDGSRRRLDKPLRLQNGQLFAPARFFELATGTRARYDDSSNTLTFTTD